MTTTTKIPMMLVWALKELTREANRKREFIRVYGRERGLYEYECQRVDMAEARRTLSDLAASALEHDIDWRAACKRAIEKHRIG